MKLIICEKPKQAKEFSTIFSKYTNSDFKFNKGAYSNGEITIS